MAAHTETLHRTIRFGLERRAGWAAIPVALAAVFAVALWLDAGTTAGPAGGSVGVVAGDVATVGGPAVPAPGSDVHPIRFARIRVAGTTAAGRRIVRWLSAGRDGGFRLRLPPGRYTFTAVLYQGEIPLRQEPHATVRVRPGVPPHVHIREQVM